MINLKMPEWFHSIRAILALSLVITFCIATFSKDIPADKLAMLEKLTFVALTFYYTLKRRKEEA